MDASLDSTRPTQSAIPSAQPSAAPPQPPDLPIMPGENRPPASADPPRFIDLAIEPAAGTTFKGVMLVLLGVAVFIALMVAVANLLSTVLAVIVAVAGMLGTLIAIAIRAEHKRKRQIDECIEKYADPAALLATLAELLRRGDRKSGFQEAAKRLVERGRTGGAARLYVEALPPPIEPLTVEFEPCPISEIDASFRGIALSADEVNESDERSETRRRFRRAWRMGGLWVNVYVLFQVVVQGFESWRAQWFTTRFLIFLAIFVALLVIQFTRVSPSSNILLIPGGLVRRRPRWLSARTGLHVFDPRTSVLIAHAHHGHQWAWTVADGQEQLSGLVTELEVRTLLRAWLSPIPPPTREMLESVMGSA